MPELPSATATPCRPAMALPTTSSTSNPSIATPATTAAPCCSAPPARRFRVRQADIMAPSTSLVPPSRAPSNAVSTARTPSSSRADGADVPSSTPRWPPRRPHCSLWQMPHGSAALVGIPPTTFNENRRAGVIAVPAPGSRSRGRSAGGHRSNRRPQLIARDARAKQAPMGRAARDVEGRSPAPAWTEAEPVFAAPAHAVAHGGVLAALPMLLRAGLLGAANRLFRARRILWLHPLFVAFMTLARVRNPESLRYQAPGEWGAILGLDRCPETKTLRRKIRLLTAPSTPCAIGNRHWHDLGHRARRRLGDAGRGAT